MAEVFLAQQRGLEGFDRRVAVKRILPHLVDSPDFVKMFLGEAKLAAQLTHPNIVHIYDFGKVETDYFIAMEYVEGIHAGQIFKAGERAPRMSPTLVARIGADVAAALNYAHALVEPSGKPYGLVHRDVSPANIMVSQDGIVKLCDFGIAKAAALSDELTKPGQVKGKYAYMSPEQTIASPLDGRSDVFSLAIVLWELLAGRTIVPRGDSLDAMRAIRDGKLAPIERVAPQTPPALAKAITWALQPKRERRATATELAQALEAFIKASPELATPMQLAQWVRGRFPRDATGPHPAFGSPDGIGRDLGTQASPGTVAGTNAGSGTKLGMVTPPSNLIAASVISEPTRESDETSRTMMLSSDDLSSTSEERANATLLDELSHEIANRPTTPRPIANRPATSPRGDRQLDQPSLWPDEAATVLAEDANLVVGATMSGETLQRSGARRVPVPSGPAVVPTRFERALSPSRGEEQVATDRSTWVRKQPLARYLLPIAGLGGLAIVSFLIALAARSSPRSTAAPEAGHAVDARALIVVIDAATEPATGPATDAERAAREPTVPPDAEIGEPATVVEIKTTPAGATLRIGDQAREAPAELELPAGKHAVLAELDGWQPERREVELVTGDHFVHEIVFTRRLGGSRQRPSQMGRLTVRTNPSSDVFHGTRKLGQTPFQLDLPVGSYVLLFKNPSHPTVNRTVRVSASRPAKVQFDLP